jgi:4-amino-4-deoxy-L-arabinose transferase-like glycosyltransferase
MNKFKSFSQWVESSPAVRLLGLLLVLQTLLHVKYLDLPPIGFHQWRQTQTLAVARNFYEENMNIFFPRVDGRGQYTGITGMEFPVVSHSIAIGYKLFGFSHFIDRTVLLLYSFLALVGCFCFAKIFFRSQFIAFFSTLFLMFSPLFSYYSITVLPDLPSLSFIFLCLYFFLKHEETKRSAHFALALVTFLLAALIKVYAMAVLPYFAYRIFKDGFSRREKSLQVAGFTVSTALIVAWYLYARFLSSTYHNFDFRLVSNFPYPFSTIPIVLRKVFVQWLPELYINYPLFIFFCVGAYVLVKEKERNVTEFMLLYSIPFLAYAVMFLPMFEIHDYYAIPALPMTVLLTTVGFERMLRRSESKRWIWRLTLAILLIMPIVGSVRSLSRFESADRPHDLLTIEDHLDRVIPDRNSLIIAAGDVSPSIYLYFMHRKGWPVGEDLKENQLIDWERNGAQYLVSSSRELESRPDIAKHLLSLSEYGRFRIYALRDLPAPRSGD